jgi:hypothetical protein
MYPSLVFFRRCGHRCQSDDKTGGHQSPWNGHTASSAKVSPLAGSEVIVQLLSGHLTAYIHDTRHVECGGIEFTSLHISFR